MGCATMLQALRDAQLGLRPHQTIPAVPGWTTSLVKRLRLEKTLEGHDGATHRVLPILQARGERQRQECGQRRLAAGARRSPATHALLHPVLAPF